MAAIHSKYTGIPEVYVVKKKEAFGPRMRKLRELAGLSQRDIASHTGLTPSYISYLEAGKRKPSFKTLDLLAAALHVPLASIMGTD